MKVIEQLILHFHARGVLTRKEIEHLVGAGYIRWQDFYGHPHLHDEAEPEDATPLYEDPPDDRLDRLGEEMENELGGRRVGGKKGGKAKVKPSGHDLTPLAAVLAAHLGDREEYPALLELGNRLTKCGDWQAAARAIADASAGQLEAALVATLNHRPPAFGELWHWCEIARLFDWAEHEDHAGPVADALAALLTADVPTQVGRLTQLKKLPLVDGLLDLLRARRAFLGALRGLFDRHFARLKVWLVNPGGSAAAAWPALPWAFVLQYNATIPAPTGYPVVMGTLPAALRPLCWEAAWRMGGVGLLKLLEAVAANNYYRLPDRPADDGWQLLEQYQLQCPLDWTV